MQDVFLCSMCFPETQAASCRSGRLPSRESHVHSLPATSTCEESSLSTYNTHLVTTNTFLPAGVTDHLAESEPHAISIARNVLGNLNMAAAGARAPSSNLSGTLSMASSRLQNSQLQSHSTGSLPAASWEDPLYPTEELRGGHPFVIMFIFMQGRKNLHHF